VLDGIAQRISAKALDPLYSDLSSGLNMRECQLRMKREALCPGYGPMMASGLCTSMKHYYLLVQDDEGVLYPDGKEKEKITGLWSKQKGCPKWLKPIYNTTARLLATHGEDAARMRFSELMEEAKGVVDYQAIAVATSVSDVERYMDPATGLPWEGAWHDPGLGKERKGGVPENSKASIWHNKLLKDLGLANIEPIHDGDKVKILFLVQNKHGAPVIAYKDKLPEEFGLANSIDWKRHWDRLILKPVADMFKSVGMSFEKRAALDGFL
jgi:hypothetical protein